MIDTQGVGFKIKISLRKFENLCITLRYSLSRKMSWACPFKIKVTVYHITVYLQNIYTYKCILYIRPEYGTFKVTDVTYSNINQLNWSNFCEFTFLQGICTQELCKHVKHYVNYITDFIFILVKNAKTHLCFY